ncbi:putative 13e12 repeat-containing protein [Mycobacterium xenopi 4042]|uniref:Putative 13e12 repeat-containing protein n=1 Tax=Mycobacterium xenopi 4042 TaxID=1299334 RepID=X7YI12_MYCXE|nr:putative 13e12 repeat-containing protein [Mycobacterium xenopi 4042]
MVVHVIAEQATLDGSGEVAASQVSADGLIPPELVTQLATSAELTPVVHPAMPRRSGVCAVEGAGRFCALPGSDLSLARLRQARV